MICNQASCLATRQPVYTVTNLASGRFIQCVPIHLVAKAMAQLGG
jgi:hypothetical protein